ncbi:MAG: protein kinase [Chloroflexi bacterium B3_Chlor]|nr:MAG: protein kinase [Chloroflexi bacterium B3_Chlor]
MYDRLTSIVPAEYFTMSPSNGRKSLLHRLESTEPPGEGSEEHIAEPSEPTEGESLSAKAGPEGQPAAEGEAVADTLAATPETVRSDEEFLSPGDTLEDRYEILKFLSKGGMGAVYLARDNRFPNAKKLVAVKEMISAFRDSVTSRISLETFEREANILASLNHPAIPKVFDYFHHDRRVFLIIEYIEGTDLESILAEIDFPLPQEKVVNWSTQVCDVLSYLHNHQPSPIVFRDMKPSNIMLRDDGRVVLVDFGIAKVFQARKRGTMIGTEGYSPPEQYRGIAEPRGDIYALGATLHHLLTRRDPRKEPPFTFHDHPIRDFNPTVTPQLEATVSKALAYEIDDRYASAEEMKLDLMRLLGPSDQRPGALASSPLAPHAEMAPLWSFECEDEIRGTPVVFENAVYFGSYDCNLYALDAETGKERWRYATDGGIVSSPCVWNETIFFGSEDQILYAVYSRTGRIVWTCPTDGRIRSSPAQEYDHIFFGSDDHHVYAVSAKSGQELWRFDGGAPIRSSPVISGELSVFGSDDGNVYALDVQTGELRWKCPTGSAVQSSPIVAEDMVYVGSGDSFLYALDSANGWVVWRYRTKGRVISSPLVSDNLVYFGSNDHHLYALDGSRGALIWKYATEAPVVSSPKLFEGAICIGSADGYLYSLDAKTGDLLWRFSTGGVITGSPAISNGVVYVGSADHVMYAVAANPSK